MVKSKEYGILENGPMQRTVTHKHFSTADFQVNDIAETGLSNDSDVTIARQAKALLQNQYHTGLRFGSETLEMEYPGSGTPSIS